MTSFVLSKYSFRSAKTPKEESAKASKKHIRQQRHRKEKKQSLIQWNQSIKSHSSFKKKTNQQITKKPSQRGRQASQLSHSEFLDIVKITNVASRKLTKLKNPAIILNKKIRNPANSREIADGVLDFDNLMKKLRTIPRNVKMALVNHLLKKNNELITCVQNEISSKANILQNESEHLVHNKLKKIKTTRSNISAKRDHIACKELKVLQNHAEEAIRKHKIFTIYGHYSALRNALIDRGWVEKMNGTYAPHGCSASTFKKFLLLRLSDLVAGLKDKKLGHVYRLAILSKLVKDERVNFYWDCSTDISRFKDHTHKPKANFLGTTRFNYSNKEGFYKCSIQSQWMNTPTYSSCSLRVPRIYNISASKKKLKEFKNNYKLTAALSLLKWIVHTNENKYSVIMSNQGTLPIWIFNFAIDECNKFVNKLKYGFNNAYVPQASKKTWKDFLKLYFKAIHEDCHFQKNETESEYSMVQKSNMLLNQLQLLHPYIYMDGYMNIWILKPINGNMVYLCRTMKEVLQYYQYDKYVVQKYIENPLLIYCTKFDINQWFLISSTYPLTIWLYKECYIRFGSKAYDLKDLHESIHSTNDSVQRKYPSNQINLHLPSSKMWFLKNFKDFLATVGHQTVYDNFIYPGIKECILGAVYANKNDMCKTSNGFELHSANFIITQDFKPWLIEIKTKPSLRATTPITNVLCATVQTDIVRVMVDHAKDPNASTGNFELIYRETT